jgi:hypothetical protein
MVDLHGLPAGRNIRALVDAPKADMAGLSHGALRGCRWMGGLNLQVSGHVVGVDVVGARLEC